MVFRTRSLLVLALAFALGHTAASAQTVAHLAVEAGPEQRVDTPLSTPLDEVRTAGLNLNLWEVTEGAEQLVKSQIDGDHLNWILEGVTPPGKTRVFELRVARGKAATSTATTDHNGSLTLSVEGRPVVSYRHAPQPVPEGADPVFARSGFLHPLWSPSGEALTRIQPPDHIHHYGIWSPWTRTRFQGQQVDFWNLGDRQGLVRHASTIQRTRGPARAGFRTLLEHVVTPEDSDEVVALSEQWDITAWNAGYDANIVDYTSTLSPAADSAITILAYRYQGFGLRGRADWNEQTAQIMTSEGLDQGNANATRARWLKVEGVSGSASGTSGILILTHPTNHNYPEHLRVWPLGSNGGVENVFVNLNPAQETDWVLEAGRAHSLRYRMVTYDGSINAAAAERHWSDFANPPRVTVTPTDLAGARVLVYTRNGEGFVHDNIPKSIEAIEALGAEQGFEVVASDDPAWFSMDRLRQFDAIVFSNTNNDIFDTPSQHEAIQEFVRSGGGVVGVHSASGSERDWPWFSRLLGGNFERHAPRQDFSVNVIDPSHPSTGFLPSRWEILDDECYYLKDLSPNLRVLVAADLHTVTDPQRDAFPGNRFGDQFPLAWFQEFDGGRQWYTTLGHRPEHYDDPAYRRHILGGLQWVTRRTHNN